MWATIVDRMSNFFGGGFFAVYWGPAAFGICSIFGISALIRGLYPTFGWITEINSVSSIIALVIFIMIITVLSYLLMSFHRFLILLYEGYWPERPGINWLKKKLSSRQDRQAHSQRGFLSCPLDKNRIKPTRLGNILAAAEEYPLELYGMNALLWWPRLVTLLPVTITTAMSEAEGSMISLLNMSTIFLLFIPIEFGFALTFGGNWWITLLLIIGSGILSRMCYHAAVSQAENYGAMIRTAFDLYRHSILKHMRIPLPGNLVDEQVLWKALNMRIFSYIPPWQTPMAKDLPQLTEPFNYSKQDIEDQQGD